MLLHADDEYEYYKVAVANGTRMTEGKVSVELKAHKYLRDLLSRCPRPVRQWA